MARDRFEHERCVGDVVRERPDLIEARCKGHQAIAADGAIGRLDPDDTAECRRLTDRAAGVGAEARCGEPSSDGGGRATARSARYPGGVVRVPSGSERRILGARPHRKLVEVRLADHDRAGFVQLGDDGGVIWRAPTVEDLRRARRRDPARAHVVLERDGHASERAGVATDRDQLVDLRRTGARLHRRARC